MAVAFLTASFLPALYDDDRLAVAALARHGVSVVPVQWDLASVDQLSGFDAVVVRSPWDWFRRRTEFRAFLQRLREVRTRVFNSPEILNEFADKRYLLALAARGDGVVPTVEVKAEALGQVPALLASHGWEEAVLKPAFTANAFDAVRLTRAEAERVVAGAPPLPEGEVWLLQPYLSAIEDGEWSLVFFDGVFSHSVKKVPRAGDWRVQHEHGGVSASASASGSLIHEATELLHRAAPSALYGRVDGVLVGERLHVMELELVEPELFFRFEPEAPERFARALLKRLG